MHRRSRRGLEPGLSSLHMAETAAASWSDHALDALERAGYRSSQPRTEVVEALGQLGCGATAKEIADRLRKGGSGVGIASVYRTLELLDKLRLVQRFEVGDGGARYEPALPGGDHHHHIVCDTCGLVASFEDEALERAIHSLSRRVDFDIDAHDVTLRGECPGCRAGR
jgi:Fur family transcriptional regulator, ferric uptake regulator